MNDIIDRLRRWAISTDAVPASDIMEEAADEIERLRSAYAAAIHRLADEIPRLRSQPCPYVTGTVTQHCTLTPFTLTDAEREAVMWAIGSCEIEQTTASDAADRGYKLPDTREWAAKHGERAATLRGLLERTAR